MKSIKCSLKKERITESKYTSTNRKLKARKASEMGSK